MFALHCHGSITVWVHAYAESMVSCCGDRLSVNDGLTIVPTKAESWEGHGFEF
jgi:hypothetical protein